MLVRYRLPGPVPYLDIEDLLCRWYPFESLTGRRVLPFSFVPVARGIWTMVLEIARE